MSRFARLTKVNEEALENTVRWHVEAAYGEALANGEW